MAKTLARPKIATSLLGDNDGEKVVLLKLYQLFSFENHPFKVLEDHSLAELTESIKEHGVTTPIIVRPKDRGEYEIISGHRRVKASQLLELETIVAFVRDLDDDEAIFQMVDTNIHREMLLPSEKAFAYKMKLEALNRRGKRTDLTYSQVGNKLEQGKPSVTLVADQSGESKNQIYRYIRLTELTPEFLDFVDTKKLPFNTAVELSYLSHEEQEMVSLTMQNQCLTPSLEQATTLKQCSKEGNLSQTVIDGILSMVQPKPQKISLAINHEKYFPENTPKSEIQSTIIQLLEQWHTLQG